jgi:hypothetical protein
MFRLFSKKPSLKDSVSACASLAASANIVVVLENGNYKAFFIYVDADGASLADYFTYPDAHSAFVSVVEQRISNRQFDDPTDGIDMVAEARQMTGWTPNLDVMRAVIGRGNTPLFRWEP